MNAVIVRAIAIDSPICVTVKKKILGLINGDDMTNAITAPNGIPADINETPIGIAAYVGSGETKPINEAEMMDRNSFRLEKEIFFPLKN
jgi:hypothetical protein